MTISPGANVYTQGAGSAPLGNFGCIPIVSTVAPSSTNVRGPNGNYVIGQPWVDTTTNVSYVLTSISASGGTLAATWISAAGGGVTSISGTANQITSSAATGAVTLSIPSAFIAPGSIASTTTLTGGTGITATTGNITATAGNLVVTAAADGLVFTNAASTSGTTTSTLNGRVGQVTITTPSIAAGATAAMTITNSAITGSGTLVGYWLTGGTTGAALTIQSYANTAGQSVVTIQNGTGATTNTASLILNFIVLN
jgi:hypothetical protein